MGLAIPHVKREAKKRIAALQLGWQIRRTQLIARSADHGIRVLWEYHADGVILGGGENAAAARDGIARCSDLSVLQAEEALRWRAAAAAAL